MLVCVVTPHLLSQNENKHKTGTSLSLLIKCDKSVSAASGKERGRKKRHLDAISEAFDVITAG